MKKIRNIIIILVVLIMLCLTILLLVMKTNNKSEVNKENLSTEYENIGEKTSTKEVDQMRHEEYFSVKDSIQKYVDTCNRRNSRYYDSNGENFNEKQIKESIYNLLSENYIKNNNINLDNVLNFVKLSEEKKTFYPLEINVVRDFFIKTYKVMGIIQNKDYNNYEMVYYTLNLDVGNNIFSIEVLNKEEYNKYNANQVYITSIQKNGNNNFSKYSEDVKKVVTEYIERYKAFTFANPQYMYARMSNEYRQKRFGSLENYKLYIKENYKELKEIVADKYMVNENDNLIQYVIKDQYQNIYIFDTKEILDNFTVKLDTYTLEDEVFNKTYDNVTEQKKAQMNIDKFFQMINRHDYRTSYNVLADSFKSKNIKTEKEFENIAKKLFFTYNKIGFLEFNELGNNTYAYSIKLTDLTEKINEEKNIQIIIQLKENRNFVISFSVK